MFVASYMYTTSSYSVGLPHLHFRYSVVVADTVQCVPTFLNPEIPHCQIILHTCPGYMYLEKWSIELQTVIQDCFTIQYEIFGSILY